jgi:arginyl-tRNA synthetase
MIKEDIEAAITGALAALGAPHVPFVVERPAEMEHGDYATNAALAAFKLLKNPPAGGPRDIAEEIIKHLRSSTLLRPDSIKEIESAGVGFINFTFASTVVKKIVHEAHEAGWGNNGLYKGKTVMVEYTDPNPFKEFHIGHLMSNAIGESIARVLEFSGANVIRANYQGDVGLHVAKAIWGKQQKPDAPWGAAYAYGSSEYESNKEAIDAINKKVYEKDSAIMPLYEEGRKHSLEQFEKIYKTLGTKFDTYFFESETWQKGLALVQANIGPVFDESDGAIIYRGEQDGLHTRVFVNKAGLPTYEAKDLGLLMLKKEAGAVDVSITITASEQQEYLKVVLAAAKHIAEVADIAQKTKHITHGMMRFAEGKMSSRTGNVITGESLLSDLQAEAKEKMQDRKLVDEERTAQQIAVSAVKYTVLRQSSGKDIVFDPAKSLSLEGDSGPYVQYALVRARAVLRKALHALEVDAEPAEPSVLERLLVHFPEVVERAARELEPHYVVTYITELAADFNSWYASERFIVDGKVSSGTVAVVKAVENTLSRGLQVLGIPAPEEM